MKLIYNKIFLKHDTGMHPENSKRLEVLNTKKETKIMSGQKFLHLYHTKEYIDHVKKISKISGALDMDTITSTLSYKVATYAVGATIQASDSGDFALVRPPGHHAHPEKSSGFCIFNNIAITTEKLVKEGKRVLIFDFDGHLGDGTEKFFYNRKDVLYFSLHQFPAFPGKGYANEIGSGIGKGYTINVPLPPGSGDDIYLDAIKKILPILKCFEPDIVAISAGFDAHKDDLLLNLKLSTNTFYKLGKIIKKNFKKYFATLEGGYNIRTLNACINSFLEGINNKTHTYKEKSTKTKPSIKKEYDARMRTLAFNLRPIWKGQIK